MNNITLDKEKFAKLYPDVKMETFEDITDRFAVVRTKFIFDNIWCMVDKCFSVGHIFGHKTDKQSAVDSILNFNSLLLNAE